MHGHNYRIDIVMQGELDRRGFIKDFAEIDEQVLPLIRKVDHRVLNDIEGLQNPTAETIAAWFLQRIPGCEKVRVYENDNCWAETSGEAKLKGNSIGWQPCERPEVINSDVATATIAASCLPKASGGIQ